MKLKQITVPPQGEGERADRLIRRYFPELPERSVRAAFLRRDVKLDGKRVPKETAAKAGQELRIYLPDEEEEIPLEIIYEDGDVLLVNKPVSTASQIFERYRYFPQGEIHALYWDGVGLALKWKTRRIRGSVAAIDLADVNNDGVLDLVVGLNTSPDLGIGSRQCMVTAYPLDLSATNPRTPADMSDFEVNPNR